MTLAFDNGKNIESFISDNYNSFDNKGDNMAEEKETPKHINDFYKKKKKADNILFSREKAHNDAYSKGIDAIVGKNGEVNLEDLEKKDNQEKVVNAMVEHYLEKAKQYLNIKKDHKFSDPLEEEMHNDEILTAYAGLTKGMLKKAIEQQITNYGAKGFTNEQYKMIVKGHTKELASNLNASAASHLEDTDIDSIVKYTKIGDLVEKDKMRINDAVGILSMYDNGKTPIGEGHVKGQIYAKKKPEGKEDEKKLDNVVEMEKPKYHKKAA